MEQATVDAGSSILEQVSGAVHERVVGQNEAVEGLLVALLTALLLRRDFRTLLRDDAATAATLLFGALAELALLASSHAARTALSHAELGDSRRSTMCSTFSCLAPFACIKCKIS